MKRSSKITTVIFIFFFIIAGVIIARTMIGNHFKKKFSKMPPPGIIVTYAKERIFENNISTFGTAVPIQTQAYKIEKYGIGLTAITNILRVRLTLEDKAEIIEKSKLSGFSEQD